MDDRQQETKQTYGIVHGGCRYLENTLLQRDDSLIFKVRSHLSTTSTAQCSNTGVASRMVAQPLHSRVGNNSQKSDVPGTYRGREIQILS
jgi:hypothetical protein